RARPPGGLRARGHHLQRIVRHRGPGGGARALAGPPAGDRWRSPPGRGMGRAAPAQGGFHRSRPPDPGPARRALSQRRDRRGEARRQGGSPRRDAGGIPGAAPGMGRLPRLRRLVRAAPGQCPPGLDRRLYRPAARLPAAAGPPRRRPGGLLRGSAQARRTSGECAPRCAGHERLARRVAAGTRRMTRRGEMDRPWFAHYPAGVPREIDLSQYTSLTALIEEAFDKYRERNAYVGFGKTTTYGEIDRMSKAIAGWLQSKGLVKGDRVAIMMPNIVQY